MLSLGRLLLASSDLIVLRLSRFSLSLNMSLMTIPYFGSCILIPLNASSQSMTRSCSACSPVAHRMRISLASLLISCSLMSKIEAFSMACWHRSVISFGGSMLIISFISSFVSFVVNVISYFTCSWRRILCCYLCRMCFSAVTFSVALAIEVLMMSA